MQIKVHGNHLTLLKDHITFPEGHITSEVFKPAVRPKLTLRFGSEDEMIFKGPFQPKSICDSML